MREERRDVTVLVADLVGSTALGERLDPEEVRLIVGEAVARIARAVEDLGGTVKDLAGDGVLALFGAPTAHEDDPERAVRAGLSITEEIAEYGREVEKGWGVEGFAVRIGVNTGPVVLGPVGAGQRVEYGATGDAVNTGARLQSAAEPGAVLVAQATRRLCEPMFDWADPMDLELKGKSEPVRAARALRARPDADARRRPVEGVAGRLVGRDRELAACRRPIDAVLSGSGGVLFLTGEAGIGKTRLLAELRSGFESAEPQGLQLTWLEGRCVSYGESLPYWPYRDLLRDWLALTVDEPELRARVTLRRRLEQLFGTRTPEFYPYLGTLLGLSLEPDAASHVAELSPEALQYRTFEVVDHLLSRLAEDGPVVVALEDLHWADVTSVQLTERLLGLTEDAAVLLVPTMRLERDHRSWRLKEAAARSVPHRTAEVALEALSGEEDRELLHEMVGRGTLPEGLEHDVIEQAEGNPFYLEELVRSLVDARALVREGDGWRFDHEVPVRVPPSVEKVLLARIDRLPPGCHDVLTAASVLGRRFGLPLLEAVAGDGELREALRELQRLDLIREGRRWPQPEYRFKHALIQEAAYGTLVAARRTALHRRAAEWLEDQVASGGEDVLGLLARHWHHAEDEDRAVAALTRAGDRARQAYALDEAIGHYRELLPLLERRGEEREMALVLFKLGLALHTALRFREADETYRRAFDLWRPPGPWPGTPSATLRVGSSFLPNDPDPRSAIAWPNIQLCMQLFDRLVEAWPERTLVPSLAERWEIAEDGLRYVFHLREGLRWSDGAPLTAHDVEFGIKRVLDPRQPGSSVAIYFVLENGQDYALGRSSDADRIGVRALDDRTVEFRLVAPAPYFLSVMNRPDGGPQPRHCIEEHGDRWVEPERQVVSGPFRQGGTTADRIVLVRQDGYTGLRTGNVDRVEMTLCTAEEALERFRRDELDVVGVRYTPRLADLLPRVGDDATVGPATWSFYLAFDHHDPTLGDVEFRRALAHAIDRRALERSMPINLVVATGGIVPPALQGHTPEIAPRFDPDRARDHLARSGGPRDVALAANQEWEVVVAPVAEMWRRELGLRVDLRWWTFQDIARQTDATYPGAIAPIYAAGWLPGYPDPEYYLRLLLHSDSRTNEGGFSHPPFDELIERARRERDGRARLELFHEADRMAVADRIALIPIAYGRSMAFVKPWIRGWSEFGKSSTSFADLEMPPFHRRGPG